MEDVPQRDENRPPLDASRLGRHRPTCQIEHLKSYGRPPDLGVSALRPRSQVKGLPTPLLRGTRSDRVLVTGNVPPLVSRRASSGGPNVRCSNQPLAPRLIGQVHPG